MDERATDDGGHRPTVDGDGTATSPRVAAEIVLPEDGPPECTLFPVDATRDERMTVWITATDGSFVGLEEMR